MSALVAPSPALLVNERGGPVPPDDVLRELRAVSPHLSLRWIANLDQSCWAVTWEWPLSDARWGRVQSGEIPREAAHDNIGYLPVGCTVHEAKSYIEAHLASYPIETIASLRAKMAHWNAHEVPQQQVSALVADTLDDVSRATRKQNPRRTRVK